MQGGGRGVVFPAWTGALEMKSRRRKVEFAWQKFKRKTGLALSKITLEASAYFLAALLVVFSLVATVTIAANTNLSLCFTSNCWSTFFQLYGVPSKILAFSVVLVTLGVTHRRVKQADDMLLHQKRQFDLSVHLKNKEMFLSDPDVVKKIEVLKGEKITFNKFEFYEYFFPVKKLSGIEVNQVQEALKRIEDFYSVLYKYTLQLITSQNPELEIRRSDHIREILSEISKTSMVKISLDTANYRFGVHKKYETLLITDLQIYSNRVKQLLSYFRWLLQFDYKITKSDEKDLTSSPYSKYQSASWLLQVSSKPVSQLGHLYEQLSDTSKMYVAPQNEYETFYENASLHYQTHASDTVFVDHLKGLYVGTLDYILREFPNPSLPKDFSQKTREIIEKLPFDQATTTKSAVS